MEKSEKDIIINVPTRLKYYLDPLFILLGSLLISATILYLGSLI